MTVPLSSVIGAAGARQGPPAPCTPCSHAHSNVIGPVSPSGSEDPEASRMTGLSSPVRPPPPTIDAMSGLLTTDTAASLAAHTR